MKIILVRHGMTNMNKKGIVQGGDIDTHINKYGIHQSNKCGDFIKNVLKLEIDYIITSPMKRTVDTAKIIAKKINYTKEIGYNKLFIERKFGKLIAGVRWKNICNIPDIGDKIKKIYNQINNLSFLDKRTNSIQLYAKIMEVTDGEKEIEFKKRIVEIVEYIEKYIDKNKKKKNNLLIVSHNMIIDAVIKQIIQQKIIPIEYGRDKNCAISIIDYKNKNNPQLILSLYSRYLDK